MIDAFATLRLPRAPWLEGDTVRAAFQGRAAEAHPDRGGASADFSEITKAYETLREPTTRLRHWLALEAPGVAIPAAVPADLMDWFAPVATELKALKAAAECKTAETALARAGRVADAARGQRLLERLEAARGEALDRVREIGSSASGVAAGELASIAARLGYLDKWIAQLREALLQLRM